MNIADYIPKGKENAVTRTYLSSLTGLSKREIERAVQDARFNSVPIISDNLTGYYIATCQQDIDMFYESMRRRGLNTFKTARAVKKIKLEERIS